MVGTEDLPDRFLFQVFPANPHDKFRPGVHSVLYEQTVQKSNNMALFGVISEGPFLKVKPFQVPLLSSAWAFKSPGRILECKLVEHSSTSTKDPRAQVSSSLFNRENPNAQAPRQGYNKWAHSTLKPFIQGNSRVEHHSASFKKIGSRAHAEHWDEPHCISSVPLDSMHKPRLLLQLPPKNWHKKNSIYLKCSLL